MAKITWYTQQFLQAVDERGKHALLQVGYEFEWYVKHSFTDPGDYKMFFRRGGRRHWTARPGQPPAVDYGRLQDSITTNYSWSTFERAIAGHDGVPVHEPDDGVVKPTWSNKKSVVVGSGVPYGDDVEFGHVENGKFVEPRPWLQPAFDSQKTKFFAKFVSKFRKI